MRTELVPFHLLKPVDEINARASKSKDGIDELAASIAAKGLIQPLAVREDKSKSKGFEIIDGRRRYQAMQKLVKAGTWDRQTKVPVLIRDDADDAEALETSLMANTVRLPMHPVDQHAVFARLAEKGASTAQIAERFGISERTVKQHMALGALAPEIRDAWRAGRIDQKAAQGFTLAPDHAVQVATFNKLRKAGGISEWTVRHALANDRPRVSGIDAALLEVYTAAGGTISESLFEEERYIDDGALLRKLRHEAREPLRQTWLADGWAWVRFDDEVPPGERWTYVELKPSVAYTPEEKRRLDALEAMPWQEKDEAHHEEEERILTAAELRAYTPELRARCGVIIDFDDGDDTPTATFGLVARDGSARLPEAAGDAFDAGDERADQAGDDPAGTNQDAAEEARPRLSAALVEHLSTTLTMAVQAALPQAPELALRCLIATLASGSDGVPMKVYVSGYAPGSRPAARFDAELARLEAEALPELLGRLAAQLTRAIDMRVYNPHAHRLAHTMLVDRLPAGAYLSAARELFSPADYFARVPKELIEEALAEMGVATGRGARKAELAALAAREAKDLGWLPPLLRHPAYALLDPSAAEPAPERGRKGAST